MEPNVYEEEHIIECNRDRSETSDTGNSAWTTALGDTVHIEPGDKISMYAGYVNARGCGTQGRTIEVKGESLKKFHPLTYSDVDTRVPENNLQGYQYADNTQRTDQILMKDNEASIGVSYYKNADGHHYYYGARRFNYTGKDDIFMYKGSSWATPDVPIGWSWNNPGVALNWRIDFATQSPVQVDTGRALFEVRHGDFHGTYDPGDYDRPMQYLRNFVFSDYRQYPQLFIKDYNNVDVPEMNLWKPKNDNKKFTMFIRRKASIYSNDVSSDTAYMPGTHDISPANTWLEGDLEMDTKGPMYDRYIEKKTITIPAGFNSGEFIAEEITRQLQQIDKETTFNYEDYKEGSATVYPTGYANSAQSECYKPFNVSGSYMSTKTKFDIYKTGLSQGGAKPQNWTDWFNQFQMIGIKRPELYETGFNVNRQPDGKLTGSRGAYTVNDVTTQDQPIVTSIQYTESNLRDLKAFLEAQAKYPEIWDDINKSFNDYTSATTIDNTRWFHMNKYKNEQQTEDSSTTPSDLRDLTPLGSDGLRPEYDASRSPAPPAVPQSPNLNRSSFLFFTHYDPAQKDTFYPVPTDDNAVPSGTFMNPDSEKYSFGCFGAYREVGTTPANYLVVIYPNQAPEKMPLHMFNPEAPTVTSNKIEKHRKLGYDLHWNAPTTVVMVPMNGTIERPYYPENAGLQMPSIRGNYAVGFTHQFGTDVLEAPTYWDNTQSSPDGQPDNPTGNWQFDGTGVSSSGLIRPGLGSGGVTDIFQFLNQIYLGASSPQLAFDGNHFAWSYLHTPEQEGNTSMAGLHSIFPENTSASQECYKLNPHELYNDYTPERTPYDRALAPGSHPDYPIDINYIPIGADTIRGGAMPTATPPGSIVNNNGIIDPDTVTPKALNRNLIPYEVYDSKTGVFIEDWGYDEATWNDGLWAILGFTYEQFHGKINSRLKRITKDNINSLSVLTTNSDVKVSDVKVRTMNPQKKPIYDIAVAHPWATMGTQLMGTSRDGGDPNPYLVSAGNWTNLGYPEINQATVSLSIKALRLPKSSISGYYGIRSDVMSECGFRGDRAIMPMLGIVNKQSAIGDFFYGSESDITYTANKKVSISSIKIRITDPDGSDADISPDSTILIKISKQRTVQYNQLAEIMGQQKK